MCMCSIFDIPNDPISERIYLYTNMKLHGRELFHFIFGIIFGLSIAFLYFKLPGLNSYVYTSNIIDSHGELQPPEGSWAKEQIMPASKLEIATEFKRLGIVQDTSVADRLYETTRIFCFILTTAKNHETKAKHVKETWGKHCNHILFMSDKEDDSLPAIKLPVEADYVHLWGKTKEAFKYLHEHHFNDADWFLKADDDAFYIMENLRYLLSNYSSQEPIWFGRRFKPFIPVGYMSGGAGYILSKKALQKFVKEALKTPGYCKQDDTGMEDVEIGKCLYGAGVKPGDSRDVLKLERFHPFTPSSHLNEAYGKDFWLWSYNYYPVMLGKDCCSPITISFHYIKWDEMHTLYFLIYRLRVWGVSDTFPRVATGSTSGRLSNQVPRSTTNRPFNTSSLVVV